MPRHKSDTSHLKYLLGCVNIHSVTAVYAQLENMVRFGVAAGTLKPGDRLPTIRELTEWIGANPNTVQKAYRDLEVMGLIYTRRGMGVYVNKGIQASCRDNVNREIISRVFEVCAEARAAGMRPSEVQSIAKECYKAATAVPYADVPKEITALARKKP
jgi:GntR family transcriptional regulator